MPLPQVNIANGSSSATLHEGAQFDWINYDTNKGYNLSACSAFCTQDSYWVPKAASASSPGTALAQLKSGITPQGYTFTDPAWNAPGQPRITINSMPGMKKSA